MPLVPAATTPWSPWTPHQCQHGGPLTSHPLTCSPLSCPVSSSSCPGSHTPTGRSCFLLPKKFGVGLVRLLFYYLTSTAVVAHCPPPLAGGHAEHSNSEQTPPLWSKLCNYLHLVVSAQPPLSYKSLHSRCAQAGYTQRDFFPSQYSSRDKLSSDLFAFVQVTKSVNIEFKLGVLEYSNVRFSWIAQRGGAVRPCCEVLGCLGGAVVGKMRAREGNTTTYRSSCSSFPKTTLPWVNT